MRPVVFERRAAKALTRLPEEVRRRLLDALDRLARGAELRPDIRRLEGEAAWRLRVGKWGAVFAYDADGNIVVLHVAPRGDVYLMSVDTVEKEDRVRIVEESGRRFAVVPLELWEDVVDKAEMLDDIEAYDRAKKALESGETELVPLELVERLCAGENPVKVWREYRGLSQRELAEKAGVAQAYVAQIETGRRKGSVGTLRRLAEALRVDLDDLVP